MTADWEEVKRLAADFQKAQLSSTLQRLSERNCVEIVQCLIHQKLIDVIYTCDGKEYITPQHLIQEIYGELFIQGGRVNLVELAKNLNVDLSHINNHIPEVLRNHKNISLVLGQLIDDNYITRVAGEINEKLSQQGQISVNDLTIQYDLPAEFLQHNVIEKQLGRLIQGRQDASDPKVFFTEAFIARSKAKIRGALAGITRPTPVNAILNQIGLSDKLFLSLFDEYVKFGSLTSRLAGAQYIPHVYARSQNEWVTNFYKQNGYLEFDALLRVGISDYKNYLKRQLTGENITTLNSCIVSRRIIDQVEADIEECISSQSYVDLLSTLPSVFNSQDIRMILDKVLTPVHHKQLLVLDCFLLSIAYINILAAPCESVIQEKAKHALESGMYQQYQMDLQMHSSKAFTGENIALEIADSKIDKREERRRKAAGGKAGGGSQGRETKTKSTKKQIRRNQQNDSDEETYQPIKKSIGILEIVTKDNVKKIIEPPLQEEGLDELIQPLVEYLQPQINSKSLELASSLYASTVMNQAAARREVHATLQNKLNVLIGDIRLFKHGIKMFSPDVQIQLSKYLIKTLCTNIVNEIVSYLSSEYGLGSVSEILTHEQRNKLINELPPEHKPAIQVLVKTLIGGNIDEFLTASEESLVACSMILKKVDKKKDRAIILAHKQGLLESLEKCEDPALILHLAVMVIFEIATQTMLHASGRHVVLILSYIKQFLNEEQFAELTQYHDLVSLYLSGGENATSEKLDLKMNAIKRIATEFKKTIHH